MAIFTDEFKENTQKIVNIMGRGLYRDVTNALSTWWIHAIILISLVIGTSSMTSFGIIGANAWWTQYAALNPNVVIEQTVQYWLFIISGWLLFIATVLEFFYVGVLMIAWMIGNAKHIDVTDQKPVTPKKIPKCPICKNNMDVIRKGMNVDKSCERFFCKSCGKYFQKKPKE